ncbi:hypothetical protein JQC76_18035 [Elizabethkingia anophelis]|uniref:hypothetical protein n=1 Tax=Elizabethkingia anophelis TaxID=1117645 RepID=UPI00193BCE68|nr:hypothetical protein [Elizabethkingia anophelis]QRI49919.1 hypothetical protein JQC76_18035 [Elizabethkingia anophelis]
MKLKTCITSLALLEVIVINLTTFVICILQYSELGERLTGIVCIISHLQLINSPTGLISVVYLSSCKVTIGNIIPFVNI